MSTPANQLLGETSPAHRLLSIFSMVRYRFFLYAGLLPYGLGAAWAYASTGGLDAPIFWSGLLGVVLAVIGVEAFNEYFDSRMGTDRVFNPDDLPPMSSGIMWLGIAAFAGALAVGIYLTVRGGWPILAFALLGGMAAIFYVAPPIRWAYRGLGELVIALSYGPWMVLGSVYLYTGAVSWARSSHRWCRAFSSWRWRSSTRFPISIRTAWSANASWLFVWAGNAPSGSMWLWRQRGS
jgi:1,4-dihydroxy-2-naphthoate octaprenyltransferase